MVNFHNTNLLSPGTRTRLEIVEATETLLKERAIESVAPAEICEEARVSRSTFYYHFKDKYEVVQWHYDYVAEQYLFETGRTLNWKQAIYRNTTEVLKHEALYEGAFKSRGYQSLFSYSKRRRIEKLEEAVETFKGVKLDDELAFQIRLWSDAEVGAMSNWFKERNRPLKELCDLLDTSVPKRLHDLLDEPVDPQVY